MRVCNRVHAEREKPMTKAKEIDNSPFAGYVLHEKAKSGKWFKYSYPQNDLPELGVKSIPLRSFLENFCEQEENPGKK